MPRPHILRRIIAAAALVVLCGAAEAAPAAAAPSPATADGGVTWSVVPTTGLGGESRTRIDYTLQPGSTVADAVVVSNSGTAPLTLALSAADATATSDGAFAVLPAGEKSTDLGAWIHLAKTRIRLAPGSSSKVRFTITPPRNAAPGDHAAGILATLRSTGASDDGSRLTVDRRVGTRVYVRVDGPLSPELTVSSLHLDYRSALYPFDSGPATVHYTITNTGNLRLGGTAVLSLRAPFGIALGETSKITLPELLPGASTRGTAHLTVPFPPGALTARADVTGLNLRGTVPVTVPHEQRDTTVAAVPWIPVGGLVLIAAAWTLLRRRRRIIDKLNRRPVAA